MYKLYLKIATRYLFKNKLYSFINIFGLAIGVASFVLIMLYVNYERSYDKFEGSENVYRVFMDYLEGDEWVPGDANAYIVSGPTLKTEFPEIEDFVRLRRVNGVVLLQNNAVFDNNTGALTDPSYFDIFDRTLSQGDMSTALSEPYSIVLTLPLAEKIFGNKDPMGKTVTAYNTAFTVTGILNENPKNTHIKNDFLVSFKTFYTWPVFENDWKYTWNQNEYYTYLKIDSNANISQLNQKIMDFEPKGLKNERHHLEAIEDIHLYSNKPYEAETNGSGNSIRLLLIIAFITIVLSWMNYLNLSTSKSLERAKEIGIRKVVGEKKLQLILQSLLESALLNVIAILIGLASVYLLLPVFNKFVGHDFQLYGDQLKNLFPYFGFMLFGTVLSAFYPAFVLSNYKPTKALKGKLQTSSSSLSVRKALIFGQFLATITLLIGAFVANKQINFLQDRPLGANINNIVALNGQVLNSKPDSLRNLDFETFISEVKNRPYVKDLTIAQTYPGDDFGNLNSNIGVRFPNGTEDTKRVWYNYAVQPNYFDLMRMDFAAGEAFPVTSQKSSNNIVINEKMAKFMGVIDMQNVVGKTIRFWNQDWNISGVVKDYHHFGLKSPIEPMIITHNRWMSNVLVKFDETVDSFGGFTDAIAQIEAEWKEVFPQSTFNYTFIDKKFEAQYNDDKKFASAFQIFTVLAILIASLGLFGLTSYTVVQRRKEIGVRKVNGATVANILSLLNKDFVKWVVLAFVIAIPISWFAMVKWLESFAYKTTMSWWIFALAGITALMVALLTVSWQSLRAATANPVDALRNE